MNPKPRIGVSSCLLGEEVRFDGAHKRNRFVTDVMDPWVEWVPVCPEVEVGMGIPREAVRLVRRDGSLRMIGTRSESDWTARMGDWSADWCESPVGPALAGYLLKSNSPSCGPFRVKAYPEKEGPPARDGRGLFADRLMEAHPNLPVEDEGRLNDDRLRENFLTRVFMRHRWLGGPAVERSAGSLVQFHSRSKMLVLAHDPEAYRALGRLVAEAGAGPDLDERMKEYEALLMRSLSRPPSRGRHVNVIHHMLGFLKRMLPSEDRADILDVVESYRAGTVPLITPITLLRHHLRKVDDPWAHGQFYLDPYPAELGLRSAV
jgi:uncharacterized protein YbgA (DUF1722 family)/uncharacterized protein YbbK (DUF523 family)